MGILLGETTLFQGTTEDEIKSMLQCLDATQKKYEKGETIYYVGETTKAVGLVLSGSVIIQCDDLWGNNSVLGVVEAGEIFSEAYACIPGEPLMVNVTACEKSKILYLDIHHILTTCSNSCQHHNKIIQNLLYVFAQKNLSLSRRILHTSPKFIRGRVLSYLSEQAKKTGSCCFTIPFNRQQLADYLGVDRSALSNELSKMQKEGFISYKRSMFTLKENSHLLK